MPMLVAVEEVQASVTDMLRLAALQIWLLILSSAAALVNAGEVPIINGVPGGVGPTQDPATSGVFLKTPSALPAEDPLVVPGKLRVVENSGLCEETPGVYQASGYADLTTTDSIWFWFFAARNKPEKAPLVLWFNGGPGSSSMYGVFQIHGPCRINNDSSGVHHNPYSWNTNANVLYIDQPAGAGFSLSNPVKVGTSEAAAVDIWSFLQIWFKDRRFKKYAQRDLGIWAESYGGHYGPTFAHYFLAQNAAIAAKKISGIPLKLTTLGIGNGLTDPLTQYEFYANYSANNPYHPLVNETVIKTAEEDWAQPGGCKDQIIECNAKNNQTICSKAQEFCNSRILGRLYGIYDLYYVPTPTPNPYPANFSDYLNGNRHKLGTDKDWSGANLDLYFKFLEEGDWMKSSRGYLEEVINAGVKVGIYAGDADFIVNYFGIEAMMDRMRTKYSAEYQGQNLRNYTVNGEVTGVYKRAGLLSYLRMFGAGHMVPAYTFGNLEIGEAALQMFEQIQLGSGLVPT